MDPGPFYNICITRLDDKHVCSTGMAYVQSCSANSVPLRIPALCIRFVSFLYFMLEWVSNFLEFDWSNTCNIYSCTFGPNLIDIEGQFHRLLERSVPQSSDVVFIVEAKPCNQDISTKKNMPQFISILSRELISAGISRNR